MPSPYLNRPRRSPEEVIATLARQLDPREYQLDIHTACEVHRLHQNGLGIERIGAIVRVPYTQIAYCLMHEET